MLHLELQYSIISKFLTYNTGNGNTLLMKKFNLQYNLEAIKSFSFGKKVSGIRLGIYKSSVFLNQMLFLLFFVINYDSIYRESWMA